MHFKRLQVGRPWNRQAALRPRPSCSQSVTFPMRSSGLNGIGGQRRALAHPRGFHAGARLSRWGEGKALRGCPLIERVRGRPRRVSQGVPWMPTRGLPPCPIPAGGWIGVLSFAPSTPEETPRWQAAPLWVRSCQNSDSDLRGQWHPPASAPDSLGPSPVGFQARLEKVWRLVQGCSWARGTEA